MYTFPKVFGAKITELALVSKISKFISVKKKCVKFTQMYIFAKLTHFKVF